MPDSKITDLTAAAALTGSELLELVQGGANVKASVASIVAYSGILNTVVALTSTEIKALNTSPKLLIAAPAAGKFIQLIAATAYYTHVSTGYSNSADLTINHTNSNSSGISDAYDLTSVTFNDVKQFKIGDLSTGWNASIVDGAALYLRAQTTNPTLGNGTMKLYLTYQIITA